MRYLRIPSPIEVPSARDAAGNALRYGFLPWLAECVFSVVGFWYATEARGVFAAELAEKFSGKEAGAVVELTDAQHEVLVLALSSMLIREDHRAALSLPIAVFAGAICGASKVPLQEAA